MMDDHLSCAMCLEEYKDPRVLGVCQHSFCFGCLDRLLQQRKNRSHLKCPICRTQCQVPAGGIASLPKNILLNGLRDAMTQEKRKILTAARTAASTSTGEGGASNVILCTVHPGKELELYCQECTQACCVKCMLENHKGHSMQEAEDPTDSLKQEMETIIESCDAKILLLRDSKKKSRDEVEKGKSELQWLEQNSRHLFHGLKQQIKDEEERWGETLKRARHSLDSAAADADDEQHQQHAGLQRVKARGQQLIKSRVALHEHIPRFKSKMKQYDKAPMLKWHCELERQKNVSIKGIAGKINMENKTNESAEEGRAVKRLHTRDTKIYSSTVSIVNYKQFFIVLCHDTIYVYNEDKEISLKKFVGTDHPNGMTVVADDGITKQLVVSDSLAKALWWFELNQDVTNLVIALGKSYCQPLTFSPEGVAVNANNEVLVLEDRYSSSVIHMFGGQTQQPIAHLAIPYGLSCYQPLPTSEFLMVDHASKQLFLFNPETNKVVQRFEHEGRPVTPNELLNAGNGTILAVDFRNQVVHLLQETGEYIDCVEMSHIGMKEIKACSASSVSPGGPILLVVIHSVKYSLKISWLEISSPGHNDNVYHVHLCGRVATL